RIVLLTRGAPPTEAALPHSERMALGWISHRSTRPPWPRAIRRPSAQDVPVSISRVFPAPAPGPGEAKKGRPEPPSTQFQLMPLVANGDLRNGRAAHFVAQDLRSPLDDFAHRLQHFRIRGAAVLLGLLLRLPEAERVRIGSVGGDE